MTRAPLSLAVLLMALLAGTPACAQQPADGPSATGECEDPFADAGRLRFDPSGWETNFCKHSVPYAEIRSGGPPRDGIPPIDDPQHVSVQAADDWLENEEPVIRLTHGGAARAYPLQVLIWHEIANDRLGGAPVVVTFCPLCYTALVFEAPTARGETLTFGTTGNLRKSDLVMWDRQTESWWQQFTGKAVAGELTGRTLETLPSSIVSWKTFKESHPQGTVLSRETGYDRAYGRNPYAGYDDIDKSPLAYSGEVKEGLPPMARVVGVEAGDAARAYALQTVRERRVLNDTLGGTPVAVFWRKGAASAVDRAQIAASKDIGQTGAFRRTLGERTLTFRPTESSESGAFRDEETGSTWNVLGEAVGGPLEGKSLAPLVHHDTFWFVWSAFDDAADLYAAERGP